MILLILSFAISSVAVADCVFTGYGYGVSSINDQLAQERQLKALERQVRVQERELELQRVHARADLCERMYHTDADARHDCLSEIMRQLKN